MNRESGIGKIQDLPPTQNPIGIGNLQDLSKYPRKYEKLEKATERTKFQRNRTRIGASGPESRGEPF